MLRKKTAAKYALIVLPLCLAAAGAVVGIRAARKQPTRPADKARPDRRELVEAARRGGLREAARLSGNYVGTLNMSSWLKFDLDTMTKASDAVVVGAALENAAHLSADGQQITTDYRVSVSEVLKGQLEVGEIIEVSLPGGYVTFEDGTTATINTPGFKKMQNGKTYILFLIGRGKGFKTFAVTGGSQGLFEVSGDGVLPYGDSRTPVAEKYRQGEASKLFFKDARVSARKWPGPAACCK